MKKDRKHLESVLEVLENRKNPKSKNFDLSKICFPKQLAFIMDKHPWVTASCSRRAGKTEVCALDLLNTASKNNNIVCLYITLTRANAERIVWQKLLHLNKLYGLGGEPNMAKLSLRFPNQSVIYLSGCKDKSELDKFRGMALKLVYLDEIQSFRSFIRDLVDEALGPTVIDYAGSIKFLGTPAPLKSGYFWDILKSDAYSHHSWTFWDNPYITKTSGLSHKELLDRELKRRGVPITHPGIRREWFGEWDDDKEALVFHYDSSFNDFELTPELTDYVIGVDLGWSDSDAIAVIGWHKHKQECYLVEELVKSQQGITELTDEIERVIKKYEPLKVVMDTGGLGKKIAEEIRKRRAIPIQAAEKTRKIEYIELLNDALRTKKFFAKDESKFAEDCKIVEWDYDKSTPDKMVIKTDPHSDVCDAVLYCYREALHWLSSPAPTKKARMTKDEWVLWTQQQMERQLQENIQHQQAQEHMCNLDIGEFPQLAPWKEKI